MKTELPVLISWPPKHKKNTKYHINLFIHQLINQVFNTFYLHVINSSLVFWLWKGEKQTLCISDTLIKFLFLTVFISCRITSKLRHVFLKLTVDSEQVNNQNAVKESSILSHDGHLDHSRFKTHLHETHSDGQSAVCVKPAEHWHHTARVTWPADWWKYFYFTKILRSSDTFTPESNIVCLHHESVETSAPTQILFSAWFTYTLSMSCSGCFWSVTTWGSDSRT